MIVVHILVVWCSLTYFESLSCLYGIRLFECSALKLSMDLKKKIVYLYHPVQGNIMVPNWCFADIRKCTIHHATLKVLHSKLLILLYSDIILWSPKNTWKQITNHKFVIIIDHVLLWLHNIIENILNAMKIFVHCFIENYWQNAN